jgi:FMN phosphatase YigB (HAD superfamily)/carbamoylphosphate synthase large subunit
VIVRGVLITSGGGLQGLALVKALRACRDVRISVTDWDSENVTKYFADHFAQSPPIANEFVFIAFLLDLCRRNDISYVFASTDLELEALARHRGLFADNGVTVFVSDLPLIALALDKRAFSRWLDDEGLPNLPSYDLASDKDVPFPIIGKPRRGFGGKGIRLAQDWDAWLRAEQESPETYLWQQHLDIFDEYSIDCSVDVRGRKSVLSIRRRIRSLGGFAVLCEPTVDADLDFIAERAVDSMLPLGARGPLNLQLLRNSAGCWITDLNARAGTSMPLSLIVGHNPIAFLVEGIGGSPESGCGKAHHRTLRTLEERAIPDLDLTAVRGVVFDLDDTLFDQKRWMFEKLSMTWYLASSALPDRSSFLSLALRIIEEGNRSRLFDAIGAELGLEAKLRQRLIDIYRAAVPKQPCVYPDTRATLVELRSRGYRTGVLTDNPPLSQKQKLVSSAIDTLVDAVTLTGELGVQKPDSRAFIAVAEKLGCETHQLIMVGDNVFRDVVGAVDAGYSHAFLLRRTGAFFNFSDNLASEALGEMKYTPINHLCELHAHLPALAHV